MSALLLFHQSAVGRTFHAFHVLWGMRGKRLSFGMPTLHACDVPDRWGLFSRLLAHVDSVVKAVTATARTTLPIWFFLVFRIRSIATRLLEDTARSNSSSSAQINRHDSLPAAGQRLLRGHVRTSRPGVQEAWSYEVVRGQTSIASWPPLIHCRTGSRLDLLLSPHSQMTSTRQPA